MGITLQRQRLASVLKRLEEIRLSGPARTAAETSMSPEAVTMPSVADALPVRSNSEISTLLELLALRDRYIQAELLALQRTLSRQTFRGAESARRLVRRLARRAEQNAQDAESSANSVTP